jgi:hypothetical protein
VLVDVLSSDSVTVRVWFVDTSASVLVPLVVSVKLAEPVIAFPVRLRTTVEPFVSVASTVCVWFVSRSVRVFVLVVVSLNVEVDTIVFPLSLCVVLL